MQRFNRFAHGVFAASGKAWWRQSAATAPEIIAKLNDALLRACAAAEREKWGWVTKTIGIKVG